MAITIKELLAADTISQASDKINFNFDQLLLNGGGPVGPPGIIGPPGPIGGRGIRGSQWFDGSLEPTDPSIIFPTLYQNDMYLEGPINSFPTGDGDVWEYNGTTWLWTGINLKGDQGTPGTSEDWGTFGNPVVIDPTLAATLYPVEIPTIATGVRAVTIGGVPDPIWTGGASSYEIDYGLATNMNNDVGGASLWLHTPGALTDVIKFSGGDVVGDYTNVYTQLSSIILNEGDQLMLKDNKGNPGTAANSQGITLWSQNRDIWVQAARAVNIQAGGNHGMATDWVTDANILLEIIDVPPGSSPPEIILSNNSASTQAAEFKVGTQDVQASSTKLGNITGESRNTFFSVRDQFYVYNNISSGADSIILDSTSGGIHLKAGSIIEIESTSDDIELTASGDINTTSTDIYSEVNNNYTIQVTGDYLLEGMVDSSEIHIKTASTGILAIQLFTSDEGSIQVNADGNSIIVGNQLNGGVALDGDNVTVGNGFPSGKSQLSVKGNAAIGTKIYNDTQPLDDSLWVQGHASIGSGISPSYNATLGISDDDDWGGATYAQRGIDVDMIFGDGNYDKFGIKIRMKDTASHGSKLRIGINSQLHDIYQSGIAACFNASAYNQKGSARVYLYKGEIDTGDLGFRYHGISLIDDSKENQADFIYNHLQGCLSINNFKTQGNLSISQLLQGTTSAQYDEWLKPKIPLQVQNSWKGTIGHENYTTQMVLASEIGHTSNHYNSALCYFTQYQDTSNVGANQWKGFGTRIQRVVAQANGGSGASFQGWMQFGGYDGVRGANRFGISWGTGSDGSSAPVSSGGQPERMRLDALGNLAIKTSVYTFLAKAGSNQILSSGYEKNLHSTGMWRANGLGSTAGQTITATLAVGGYIKSSGVWNASDARKKIELGRFKKGGALKKIIGLNPVFYAWNEKGDDPNTTALGFFAQEVEEIIPEAVSLMKTDDYEDERILDYDAIFTTAVGAIKDLNDTVKDQQKTIEDLEARLQRLEEKL